MSRQKTVTKVKTILLSGCLLASVSLFAQSEKTTEKSTIVMTKSELNSFLTTVADARRAQLKERENKQLKNELIELRSKYQQRSTADYGRQDNISNQQLLNEIRYLNQRIDNMSPRSSYNDTRYPSSARDNSTIIMPGNVAATPQYNPGSRSSTTVIPSNKKQINDLQFKIDSLKSLEAGRNNFKGNSAFSDSLSTMKSRLSDVRKQMAMLESKMDANIKPNKKESEEDRTYFRQQVYFANNSATLEAEYFKYVQDLTQILMEYPEAKILLEGWASPLGKTNYNKQLSMRRAESVQKAFINNRIDASRILTSFKGEDTTSSEQHARRVEMSIIVR